MVVIVITIVSIIVIIVIVSTPVYPRYPLYGKCLTEPHLLPAHHQELPTCLCQPLQVLQRDWEGHAKPFGTKPRTPVLPSVGITWAAERGLDAQQILRRSGYGAGGARARVHVSAAGEGLCPGAFLCCVSNSSSASSRAFFQYVRISGRSSRLEELKDRKHRNGRDQ